jgi:broad specificity phosphatase PhoE
VIYLIRHGEPAAGWGEHPDPGLSDLGRAQAEAASLDLARAGARRALTSPLARCRETAGAFERRLETHARIEPAIGEIPTPPDVPDRPVWLKSVMAGVWSETGDGLGPWRDGLLAAIEACPEETAVFTHFVAINVIVGALTGEDRVLVFRPGHASITRLERRAGRLALVSLGEEGALRLL